MNKIYIMKKEQIAIFGSSLIFFLMLIINYHTFENLLSTSKYDTNNYDVEYHDTVKEIEANSSNGSWLIGHSGKLEYVSWSEFSSKPRYYEGKYIYGGNTWVPTYFDSILLRSTPQDKNTTKY